MRILHSIITAHYYGSEHYCAQLASLQAAEGHEIQLLLKGKNRKQIERFRQAVGPKNVRVIPQWWPSFLDGVLINRYIKTFVPDIVHTHLGRATRRVGKVARARGIAHVASLHLNYNAKTYAACDGLVCVAGWQHPQLSDGPKPYRGITAVLRNWVPLLWHVDGGFLADKRQTGALDTMPGQGMTLVLGSVGRLDRQKGYDVLIPAFRQGLPVKDYPDVQLVIVGEGPDRAKLLALAEGDPRIRLVGYQTNIPTWLAGFDAFISASRFEGLALVVLEAMGAGLPLLLTDVAGNAELAGLQAPGVVPLVAPQDEAAMAVGLQALVARLADGRAARVAYDISELDSRTVVQRMDAFYAAVLAARAARQLSGVR